MNVTPLFIIIPLASALLIPLLGRLVKRSGAVIIFISSVSLLGLSLYAQFLLKSGDIPLLAYRIDSVFTSIGISLVLDGLSSFMLVVVNMAAFFVVLYSFAYMEKYTDKPKFFSLFSLMVCGMNGVILNGDLFNLYVFLEVASISSYALVAFGTGKEELEASFKYAVMGSMASAFILMAIAFLYGLKSTLDISEIGALLSQREFSRPLFFIGVLLLTGFGLKAALVPFHAWLPDAHSSAPAPVSAMLSGVLIKTLGVYCIARCLFVMFGGERFYLGALMFLGAFSIIIAGMLSLSQSSFKRLLAYSSVSQVGYIVLGLATATPLGVFGALFHLFNHSVMKPLLFLTAGAIEHSSGRKSLKEAGGLGKLMPVTSFSNLIGSMAISGIPPFAGFFSKVMIIIACVQGGYFGYAFCAVIGSVLTLSAMAKVRRYIFSGEIKAGLENVKEGPFIMKFSMLCLVFICVSGGFLLLPQARFFIENAVKVLIKG